MRNEQAIFLKRVKTYLETFFNEKAKALGIEPIKSWQVGYPGIATMAHEYPACILLVPSRTLDDTYTTSFNLYIGIGIKHSDMSEVLRLGSIWTDLVEDAIRNDWHLGDACIDVEDSPTIDTEVLTSTFMIHTYLECSIDLGGFVYEEK